jgi:ABC-type transporter Mla subunit MlaD
MSSGPKRIPRNTLVAGSIAVSVAAVAVAVAIARSPSGPPPLEDLERAGRAGRSAQEQTARIIESLQDIAGNLQAGSKLSGQTDEIHALTDRQRRSLQDLIVVLRDQLDALGETRETLEGTGRAASGVARIGARQAALIARSVDALERLKGYARGSTAISARFARQALYGARLAEDSRRRFSEP